MFWKNKSVKNHVPGAVKPPEDVLIEFKDLAMVTWMSSCGRIPAEWFNWAIEYTGSDGEFRNAGEYTEFKDLRIMHEAALKYSKGGSSGE